MERDTIIEVACIATDGELQTAIEVRPAPSTAYDTALHDMPLEHAATVGAGGQGMPNIRTNAPALASLPARWACNRPIPTTLQQ